MKLFGLGTRSFFLVAFSEKTLSYNSPQETGNTFRKKKKKRKKNKRERRKNPKYLN